MWQQLSLDATDVRVLALLSENPFMQQSELAKKLGLTQPSIHARLKNLKRRGLLGCISGIDASQHPIVLARVDFTTKFPEQVLAEMEKLPAFVQGFIMSGERNVSVLLAGESVQQLNTLITSELRQDDVVHEVSVSIIVRPHKQFIVPVKLDSASQEQ